MATAEMSYRASEAITMTSLNTLGTGNWAQSLVVDNSSYKDIDAYVGGTIKTHASVAPTDGSTIDIYVYGEMFDGDYSGKASGTDTSYTADGNEDELMFLTAITVDTSTGVDYDFGPVSVAAAFGGVLPRKWGLVIENNTGQSLHSSGHTLKFTGTKYVSS